MSECDTPISTEISLASNCNSLLTSIQTAASHDHRHKKVGKHKSSKGIFSIHAGKDSLQNIHERYFVCKSSHDHEILPDRRLIAWNNWIEERKKVYKKLTKQTKRPECELILNTINYYRPKIEDHILFEYSTIMDPPDPERGSPAFWTIPVRIMPKGIHMVERCCSCCGDGYVAPLEAQLNMFEKCEVPTLKYIGVPDKIIEEQGIAAQISESKYVFLFSLFIVRQTQNRT